MDRTPSINLGLPSHTWSRRAGVLALAAFAFGCGGSVQFADRTAIAVVGHTPAQERPEPEAPRVELREDRIVINEKIQFAYNDDQILSASFSLLDEVGAVIKQNPRIKKIEIGGHASTEGSDEHNLQLSDRRANAVMKHLVERAGIEPERLASRGYGEVKPLVHPDDTEEQRELNRRVEFLILEQEPAQPPDAPDAAAASETLPATPDEPSSAQTSGQ